MANLSERYRLLCTCGAEHLVQPQDAGQRVTCRCGASLEVPTLRRLLQLPLAQPEGRVGAARQRPWSFQQGLFFNAGLVILALSLFTLVYLGRQRATLSVEQPVFPYQEFAARDVGQWTVVELWAFWSANRGVKLDARPTPHYLLARQAAQRLDRFLVVAMAFGVVGFIITLAAGLYRPGK